MKQIQILQCNQPILGRRIRLERLNSSHAIFLQKSFSDEVFWSSYRANQPRNISIDQLTEQLQFEYERTPTQVGKIEWVIVDNREDIDVSGQRLGLVSLSALNARELHAEFMIGFFSQERKFWGASLEAALLAFHYAFKVQKLSKLMSYVYEQNSLSQQSTLSLGFRNTNFLENYLTVDNSSESVSVFVNSLTNREFFINSRLSALSKHLLGYDVTSPSNSDEPIHKELEFQLQSSFTIK